MLFPMQYFALLLTLAAMLASPVHAAPPLAAVRDVIDTHHGVAVHDPYRDLEDIARPETQAWMKTQSEHARAVLDGLPGRAALAARIAELTASSGGSEYSNASWRSSGTFHLGSLAASAAT